jgi:pimeloyl-ACP methyl ester carboxylesterase
MTFYAARSFLGLISLALLPACAASVNYGKIPHPQYVADKRCAAEPAQDAARLSDAALFLVTSRLPDCRTQTIALTNFRSEQTRYGRFDAPRPAPGKGQPKLVVPLSFQREAQWWADLESAMIKGNGRVLVYVHGYRETFASNSRDSFQMKRLTEFAGPIIQYSWPSQGALFGYLVDETNIGWDEQNFRRFLSKLATRAWTKEIILVSHSMGARLVIPAVEFVDRNSTNADSSNISNIILASPDIDRQDFERDIAEEILSPRRVARDRRITVYVSRRDKALAISRQLHGYPRLGSPYCFDPFEAETLKAQSLPERCYAGTVQPGMSAELSGLTIVDTTDVGGKKSGHSDFLKTSPGCLDFKAIVAGERGRIAGRLPTRLPHVFLLPKRTKISEKEDLIMCRRGA